MTMTVMEAIKEFIARYPNLDEFNRGIGVDLLEAEPTAYAIESVPAEPVLKSYIDGTTERQQVFVFSSREAVSLDVRQQLENIGFFEGLADWFEVKSAERDLPSLGEGREAVKIEVTTTGYAYDVSETEAKYQIQCRLVYLQEANYGRS